MSKHGLYFPIVFVDKKLPEPDIVSSITASLRHILVWFRGTRYFNPNFGSGLHLFLGTPCTPQNLAILKSHIELRILSQEKRIDIKDIELKSDSLGNIKLEIQYIVKRLKLESSFETEI